MHRDIVIIYNTIKQRKLSSILAVIKSNFVLTIKLRAPVWDNCAKNKKGPLGPAIWRVHVRKFGNAQS